jgi:hypothetical protein
MIEIILLKMSKSNRNSEWIRFAWYILLEQYFLDEFLRMQPHLSQNARVLSSLYSD